MALTDLTRISTSGIATGSTIDAPILRKDVSFRGSQVGVTSALFDSSDNALEFNDNVKIKLGNGGDLELYHTGARSEIINNTGDLIIQPGASSNLFLRSQTGAPHFKGAHAAQVEIYYNGNEKIRTTPTGAIVTGILTATSFSGPVVGNTNNASGISTFYDLRVSNNLTVEGTTTTLDTNLIDVDRIEVGANSNTIVGVAITQSGSADILRLYDGASQVVTVDDEGKVGIGVTIPNNPLTVHGSGNHIYLKDTATNNILQIRHAAGVAEFNTFGTGGARRDYVFNQYASEVLRIKSNGRVGIGTNNPNAQLDVYQTGSGTVVDTIITRTSGGGAFAVQCSNVAAANPVWALRTYYAEDLVLSPGGNADVNEKVRIKAVSGNVGIGTNDPQKKLEVYDGDIYLNSTDKKIFLSNDYDQYITANAASNYLVLGAANKERFRITSDGNLVIKGSATNDNFRMDLRVNDTQNEFRGSSNSTSHKSFVFYSANTNTSEKLRITSIGAILTAGVSSEPLYPHYVTARKVQMEIKGAIDVGQTRHHGSLAVNCTNSNSSIHLVRSDNTQTDGTHIGVLGWVGYDGSDFHQAAAIEVIKGAGAGSDDQPGHMLFKTNTGTNQATEKLRITSDGHTIPGANTSYDLGANVNNRWRNIYGQTLSLTSYATIGAIVAADPGSNYYSYNNRIGNGLAIVGSTRMFGRVGINTTTDSMDGVTGNLNIANDNFNNHTVINLSRNTTSDRPHIRFQDPNGNVGYIGTYDSDLTISSGNDLIFRASSTDKLRITSNGNVLIDTSVTTEASADFDDLIIGSTSDTHKGISIVGSTTGGIGSLAFTDGASYKNQGIIQYRHADDSMRFTTAQYEALCINSSRSVIVGGGATFGVAGTFSVGANGTFRSVLASGTAQDTLIGGISGVSNGFQVTTSASNVHTYKFHSGTSQALTITDNKTGVLIGSPFSRFQCGSHTFSGGHGMYENSRVGMSNHGSLTGLMLASTYNDSSHPEYGLVFVQGPNTSSYNVWSISPDGPSKGNSLNLHYAAQATNIHSPSQRKFEFDGDGNARGIDGAFDSRWGDTLDVTIDTASWAADTFYRVVNDNVFDSSNDTYLVWFKWSHDGSGAPWLITGNFLFTPTGANTTGAVSPVFTPVQVAHNSASTISFRGEAGGNVRPGLSARADGWDPSGGDLYIKASKIGHPFA